MTGFIFARFSGNAEQGIVREFELDHFLSQLEGKISELGNFYLIFHQFLTDFGNFVRESELGSNFDLS